ncbi:DUF3071 domain-containing protein [Leucobacter sp. cx-42]|uniref:septation protein SepH n=1 Tax=unclassified Leucobacter TaxID=2621730 RepID=UPI00165E386D|nr:MULTISPECIES: septation protein SepH [unclassified Leucobacter]MBC9954878.1 DUF3071 domain-containing protein [Leucobacter sp. cx-42]
MDELRVVRSEEQALIIAADDGTEFRLVVDEVLLAEIRQVSKRERRNTGARPREIQSLLRAGKSRLEVARITELDEQDVARFEEPVLAERRYILDLAKEVAVRTDGEQGEQSAFGDAVEARLTTLGADEVEWRSWKGDGGSWHIGLAFATSDAIRDAVWEFDHKKSTLRPLNPDATHLSKQGDVAAQLIPKLRAVDAQAPEPVAAPEPEFVDHAEGLKETREITPVSPAPAAPLGDSSPTHPTAVITPVIPPAAPAPASTQTGPQDTPENDYERRREIEDRAMNMPGRSAPEERIDMSQTADLLDALRRRRGDREQSAREAAQNEAANVAELVSELPTPAVDEGADQPESLPAPPVLRPVPPAPDAPNISAAFTGRPNPAEEGISRPEPVPNDPYLELPPPLFDDPIGGPVEPAPAPAPAAPKKLRPASIWQSKGVTDDPNAAMGEPAALQNLSTDEPEKTDRAAKKGRSSIPSWDDILFGTRSEDDPA